MDDPKPSLPNTLLIRVPDDRPESVTVAMERVLAEPSCRHAVVNLRQCAFMGSAGLGQMIRARKVLASRGGEFVLSQPPRGILRTLHTLGLDAVLPAFATDQEAFAYLGGDGDEGGQDANGVAAPLVPRAPTDAARAQPPGPDPRGD